MSYGQTLHDPSLFSARRLVSFVTSVAVGLGSGTHYAFSAYAPQLGSRLNINNTQLNLIGAAQSIGASISGPVAGWLIDSRGPRPPLAFSFLFLLIGYSGIRLAYDQGLSPDEETLPIILFLFLVLCGFLIGAAGSTAAATAVNSTAKTFPNSARATAVGLVLSGVGFSAFFLSNIAQVLFPGDISHLLLILILGTTLPMVLGFFLVRPIPLPKSSPASTEGQVASPGDPLLQNDALQERERGEGDLPGPDGANGAEMNRLTQQASSGARYMSRERALLMGDPTLTNMFGKRMFRSLEFWLLFVIFSLLTGVGIMYINNVGSISQVLYAKESPIYDGIEAQKWQTAQVSAISIMNCIGRILIGLICDYFIKLGVPRSASLVLVSLFFLLSQVTAASIESVKSLWIASSLLGLAYGTVYSSGVTMCMEWFGIPHLGENMGYFSIAPLFSANLFSLIFGRNLDAHESQPQHIFARVVQALVGPVPGGKAPPRCLLGKACYVDILYLTMVVCLFVLVLSLWACWRDREMMKEAASARLDQ